MCIQEPFVNIPEDTIREALKVALGTLNQENCTLLFYPRHYEIFRLRILVILILFLFNTDARNHPVLIHCKRGKVWVVVVFFNPCMHYFQSYIYLLNYRWLPALNVSTGPAALLAASGKCRDGAFHPSSMSTSVSQLPKPEFRIKGLWSCLTFRA